jgi:hypothetical protein
VKISGGWVRSWGNRVLVIMLAVGCLTALGSSRVGAVARPSAQHNANTTQPKGVKAWQKIIQALPVPRKANGALNVPSNANGVLTGLGGGCFTAHYPKVAWLAVPCETAPAPPEQPRTTPVGGNSMDSFPTGNGGGTDYVTETAGSMSSVTGTITYVTAGTQENGLVDAVPGSSEPDSYSIQLNSGLFSVPSGQFSQNPGPCSTGCEGWEQFVYNSTFDTNDVQTGAVLIQNWLMSPTNSLVTYGCPTPPGWSSSTFGWNGPNTFKQGPGSYCLTTSNMGPLETPQGNPVPTPTPPQLMGATLTSSTSQIPTADCGPGPNGNGDGWCDTVVFTSASGYATAVDSPEVLGLEGNWSQAEFGIYGDAQRDEANFSNSSSPVEVDVQTTVNSPTSLQPTCLVPGGFTGESNNLNLPANPQLSPWPGGPPTMTVKQTSTQPSQLPSCVNTDGWSTGETHLGTFQGATYDFQASGDFVDATTGPNFTVEARQVPVPSYPDVTFNQGIAVKIGTSDVAVCSSPQRLFIDGSPVDLAEGAENNLPGGGDVSLDANGNVYVISDATGDWVQARVEPSSNTYPFVSLIDERVGLGQWPTSVRGLLANAGVASGWNKSANARPKPVKKVVSIESSDGTVLTAPFKFSEFYGLYTNSWRVPASQSLLNVCGGEASIGVPQQVFYANKLGASAAAAKATCLAAGVTQTWLLNNCTLDVAVLGGNAASVYAGIPTPDSWGKIQPSRLKPAKARCATASGSILTAPITVTASGCRPAAQTGGSGVFTFPNIATSGSGTVTWNNGATTTFSFSATELTGKADKCPDPAVNTIEADISGTVTSQTVVSGDGGISPNGKGTFCVDPTSGAVTNLKPLVL